MGSMIDIAKIIACKYNVDLSEEGLQRLVTIMSRKELKKGEVYIPQRHVAKDLVWVESGLLRQYYYKKNHDVTEHFTDEGTTLAYCTASLFKSQPTDLMMEAIEPSIIYTLDYKKLKTLSFSFPEIAQLLINILEYGLMLSQQKADSWRFETAHERYERFMKEYPYIANRASVNHIASYLLMAPESLSRVRAGVL